MNVHSTSPEFKQNAARALNDSQLQKALGNVKQGFIDKRQMAADKLPEFEALRDSARDIKNHTLEHLDLYLEAYEEKVTIFRRARAFRPGCAGSPRYHPDHLPRGRREDGDEGQVHDLRGDRASTITSKRTASGRSRPISANTSSSCATSCRATSSRRPSISTPLRSRRISGAFTPISTPSAISPSRCSC